MAVALQIALGSGMILICAALELVLAAALISALRKRRPFSPDTTFGTALNGVGIVFLVFLLAHTLHIYLWAAAFWGLGALPGYEEPIYFALVSYSTLGYGDLTLGDDFRIFGAMSSICGVLMFGLTTAFLVGVFTRMLSH